MTPYQAFHARQTSRPRRGVILLVTLVLVFVLAALVLTMGASTQVDATIAANELSMRQAALAQRGAEQYVLALVAESLPEEGQPLETRQQSDYEAVTIGGGYIWLLRPDYADPSLPAFGLVDETSKLDLNAASYERLRLLPGMTDEIAASIVDWRDEDDDATEEIGAESTVYLGRSPGYSAKNAGFEFVEELLLVEGVARDILYGSGEISGVAGVVEEEQFLPGGLFDAFTIYGTPASALGQQLLDVNDSEVRDQVRELLREVIGGSRGDQLADRVPNGNTIDLFDFARRLDMTGEELDQIADHLTVGESSGRGKLNINTAPQQLLLSIPNVETALIDELIAQRSNRSGTERHGIGWVYDTLRERSVGLGLVLTGRGSHYSADILAASSDGRAFRRVRIVVDTTKAEPTIVYRRDISANGWPLDVSILQSLREGNGVGVGGLLSVR